MMNRPDFAGFVSRPWRIWQFHRKANVFFRNAGWVSRSKIKNVGTPRKERQS